MAIVEVWQYHEPDGNVKILTTHVTVYAPGGSWIRPGTRVWERVERWPMGYYRGRPER